MRMAFRHLLLACCFVKGDARLAIKQQQESTIDLPLQDVNILVVTDVHSWVAGHGFHEPGLNADYGDVLSFYQRLKEEHDVLFVMNGDFMDGTGLSTIPPSHLTPILEQMPWDAVNMGNHELYFNETVMYLQESGFFAHWNGHYLTSNTVWSETSKPIGNRYTFLETNNKTLLTFGFLYNFTNNCAVTHVEAVQDTVRQAWFVDVLRASSYDAILVLAHMDCVDPLVYVILEAIRDIVGPDVVVQFITGHSHRRAFEILDAQAASFEAGRFLDTVGFVSFNVGDMNSRHVFLDPNRDVLNDTLGDAIDLATPDGIELRRFIHRTQQELGLNEVIGCSPRDYKLAAPLDDPASLWALYLDHVIPIELFRKNQSNVFVQTTGGFRYNLMQGPVRIDDISAVCPFNDTVYEVTDYVSGADIIEALGNQIIVPYNSLPVMGSTSADIDPDAFYALFVADWNLKGVVVALSNVTGEVYRPIPATGEEGGAVTTTNLWRDFVANQWSNTSVNGTCWNAQQLPDPLIKHDYMELLHLLGNLAVSVLVVSMILWLTAKLRRVERIFLVRSRHEERRPLL